MRLFDGSAVALATPFINGSIDYNSMWKLLEYHIEKGTDAIVVCGTTGEASTMSYDEQLECIKYCVDVVDGRIPVIAGTGSNCTKSAIRMAKEAEMLGVDGLLVVTPYYNKATQNGLIKHYGMIADSVSIPIIMYNVPGRTGCNLEPETAVVLAKKHDNIIGIKEASGNLEQVAKLSCLIKNTDCNLDIYSGNDDQVYDVLELGGRGVISVNANIIPEKMHLLVSSFLHGNYKLSQQIQKEANELANVLFSEVNPIPVKYAMYELGMIKSPELRLPLTELEDKNVKKMQKLFQKKGYRYK